MKEAEIRPKALFEEYLALSRKDGEALDKNHFTEIACPACGAQACPEAFKKHDYSFKNCPVCNSLFCSPRPNQNQLNFLYSESKSSEFWSKVFFPAVAEARKQKLFAPKALEIHNLLQSKGIAIESLCDVGAGHGMFLEELAQYLPRVKLFAIEPDQNSAQVCLSKGIEVLNASAEDARPWHNKFDFALSSEVIEHVFDPLRFVSSMADLVKPNGYLLMTGLGFEGFDILTLGEHSNSVSPPHHLNFFSVTGFEKLFGNAGFRSVEIWTPGKLDVDIVLNAHHDTPFVKVLRNRGEAAWRDFQAFLVRHRISSHMWILAQK